MKRGEDSHDVNIKAVQFPAVLYVLKFVHFKRFIHFPRRKSAIRADVSVCTGESVLNYILQCNQIVSGHAEHRGILPLAVRYI